MRQNQKKKWALLLALMMLVSREAGSIPLSQASLLDQTLEKIASPQALVRFLKDHFRFADDGSLFGLADYWQAPEEFLTRRSGDCEDYALFAQEALQREGFKSYVVSFYGQGGWAHTIVVFEDKGKFSVINEDRLYLYRAKTIEEALTRVYPLWSWGAFAERRGPRGWSVTRFKNPVL